MPRYVVEIIDSGKIERTKTVEASTPIKAAETVVGTSVTFRRNEDRWIKVVRSGSDQIYQFVNQ